LVFLAVALIPLLGMVGLAIDGARAYIARAALSRAVDAGCLAAAKVLRQGQEAALQEALAVAAANGVIQGQDGVALALTFGTNAEGESTVAMSGTQPIPTFLMQVLGFEQVTVASAAEATVPPIDLVLVVDRSGSLATQNAWDDLQRAVLQFVGFFDDKIDQLGLTSFQVRANDEFFLNFNFTAPITAQINQMNSAGDTNTGEGLRFALQQLQRPNVREPAVKVVVFFTDGRPTAFRGTINGEDRALAVSTRQTGRIRGYFDDPDQLPMNQLASPDGCAGVISCYGWTEDEAREQARENGITLAAQIRATGAYLYTIGLGNPDADDPILVPDLNYLQLLANVNGVSNPNQPMGQSYFAPSPDQLEAVFKTVAEDLLVRLSR
jgi:hypothetical protein